MTMYTRIFRNSSRLNFYKCCPKCNNSEIFLKDFCSKFQDFNSGSKGIVQIRMHVKQRITSLYKQITKVDFISTMHTTNTYENKKAFQLNTNYPFAYSTGYIGEQEFKYSGVA